MDRHFREIQIRSFYLFLSFFFTILTTFWFSLELIYVFVYPFLDYERHFICTQLTEPLWSTLQICVWTSFYLFLPLPIYQGLSFFLPSCHSFEKKKLVAICLLSLLLWNTSLLVCHSYLAPKVWDLLLNYQVSCSVVSIQLETRISSYIESASRLFGLTGLFFQAPLILFVFLERELINANSLSRGRIWFSLSFFLGASLLSPPDWKSQLALATLFFVFFEVAVWFAFLHKRVAIKRWLSTKKSFSWFSLFTKSFYCYSCFFLFFTDVGVGLSYLAR